MNHFQVDFDYRLRSWARLRQDIADEPLAVQCQEIDRWWQQAPLVNHYLHWHDQVTWPKPWELLAENTYCSLAKALGMCYTLLLIGVDNGELVIATDNLGAEYYIVTVSSLDDAVKYVMSYHPNTVLSNKLSDFTIKNALTFQTIKSRIN
jgi:hypothetical protein